MSKQDDMKCDICGFDLRDETGYTVTAVEVALLGAVPERERVEKMFGKFKFKICHVCYLKSLGIRPTRPPKKK